MDIDALCVGRISECKDVETVILEGRKGITDLLDAPSHDTIISGESATSLIFNLSYAVGKQFTGQDNIVTTDNEYHANLSPWLELEKRGAIREIRFVRLRKEDGTLNLDHFKRLAEEAPHDMAEHVGSKRAGDLADFRVYARSESDLHDADTVSGRNPNGCPVS